MTATFARPESATLALLFPDEPAAPVVHAAIGSLAIPGHASAARACFLLVTDRDQDGHPREWTLLIDGYRERTGPYRPRDPRRGQLLGRLHRQQGLWSQALNWAHGAMLAACQREIPPPCAG